MSTPIFQPGQVVQLKSGGPRMTVAGADSPQNMGKVLCMWFHADSLSQSGYFDPATLVLENLFPSVPPQQPSSHNTLCTDHFDKDNISLPHVASQLQHVVSFITGLPISITWVPAPGASIPGGWFEVSAPLRP